MNKEKEKTEDAETHAPEAAVVEEVKLEVEKDIITDIPEEEAVVKEKPLTELDAWKPKTSIGKKVKSGEIKDIDEILDAGLKILEPEITDVLLPNMDTELLMIGQSKGKFGGGARRVFMQTQKKTPEGNKPSFSCFAVVGNKDGYVGSGCGKSKDTVPAREKAIRKAKLNIIKIRRGCGSWECGCKRPHTIPFAVAGRCGSCRIRHFPAPRGKGLCVEEECAKVLGLAGVKDVWSKTFGQTRTKRNLVKACIDALKNLAMIKVNQKAIQETGMIDGRATSSK